ncbi:hypothetical protein WJX73_004130 [Symbiochloris irregularis]|uniref:F-box domain-containing protein n=1 Tax=Symbiochloris irregularis TaxID=706552 RepID=A0AAW1PT54_9CHLO
MKASDSLSKLASLFKKAGSTRTCPEIELPEDVWCLIFAHLEAHELMSQVALVCKSWLHLATSKEVWRSKLPSSLCLPEAALPSKACCQLHAPCWPCCWAAYCRSNMLHDPDWRDCLLTSAALTSGYWELLLTSGSCMAREEEPRGISKPAPWLVGASKWAAKLRNITAAPQPSPVCMAMAHDWGGLVQIVDLLGELAQHGFTGPEAEAFLDSSPRLSLSVWCGARYDCKATARVKLLLCSNAELHSIAAGGAEGRAEQILISWTLGTVLCT